MAFDPKQHIIQLKGKDYLTVPYRLVWFREVHPKGMVTTDVQILTENLAIVKATVFLSDGSILSQGTSTVRSGKGTSWAGREVEKAETAAIGRALAHSGFGAQFDPQSDDTDYLADSPVATRTKQVSETTPQSPSNNGTPSPFTMPYEQLDNRRKKVFAGVKSEFDENFGKYMEFCNELSVDWNQESETIIHQIMEALH